jgi:HD-GYP domain-containing protein (c-di-GMP phosphodiesterase class II)
MKNYGLEAKWHDLADNLGVSPDVQAKLDGTMLQLSQHHLPTAEHCMRVGMSAVRIGTFRGLPLKPLFYGGSLHDRGKLMVDTERLSKTTDWTLEDAQALRIHPIAGYEMILEEGMVVTAGLVLRHHTFQPNGYPDELPTAPPYMTEDFNACARTIALADYYDAAHRSNSEGKTSGLDIKAKVQNHNPDLTELIEDLYTVGIFDTETRPF